MHDPKLTRRSALLGTGLAAGALAMSPLTARAQEWPSRLLKIFVGFPPGGSPDVAARLIANKLSPVLKQSVIIEQAVGGGGIIASTAVAKAPPDGYTMVMLTGAHGGTAAMRKSLPYDPLRDFDFLTMVVAYPMILVVPVDSPFKTLRDVIDQEKKSPGSISYASNAPGSIHHLLGEWINIEAGTSMVAVPYRGASQSLVDLLGGRVNVMIDTATTTIEPIRAGKVRAIAISSPARYPLAPDIPTIGETLRGVEAMSWLGLATAPGTPKEITDRLGKELREILQDAEVKERFGQLAGVTNPTTADEMRAQIAKEIDRWNRIVDQKKIERQ